MITRIELLLRRSRSDVMHWVGSGWEGQAELGIGLVTVYRLVHRYPVKFYLSCKRFFGMVKHVSSCQNVGFCYSQRIQIPN